MFGRRKETSTRVASEKEVHISAEELRLLISLVAWLNPENYSDERLGEVIALAQSIAAIDDAVLFVDV